ncbi:MAG: RAD55 family ATPase [Candidatus Thermoplasmatota archaeon]
MLASTGIDRLDELLKGGIPLKTNVLVYAPPFIGKEIILKRFALSGLKNNEGVIFVLTDNSFSEVREEMSRLDPSYREYENKGMVRYIDVYSKSVELEERDEKVIFIDSPVNREKIASSIIQIHRENAGLSRMIFDSLSTLIVYSDAKAVFRFLQVLSGICSRIGLTSLFSMTRGMHDEVEVQTMKHLMDGVIELREEGAKMQLRVQGCGEVISRHWVDYTLEEDEIRITGAFRMGRVA